MRQLAEYVVSITAAAIVCGIVTNLIPKGTARELLKLVGGLFLIFTVIQPISNISLPDLAAAEEGYRQDAAQAAALGESLTEEALRERRTQELEAYILDKARALRIEVDVQVQLGGEGYLPESVRVEGKASPHGRQTLMAFLTGEMGIQEEKIQWNDPNSGSG